MTTAKKLWLGFGALIALVLGSTLVVATQLVIVQNNLVQITGVTEPISAAAYEMEIKARRCGAGVLQYLDTGEPRCREAVVTDEVAFRTFKQQYDRLAGNPALSERIGVLDREFYRLGKRLMDDRDRQQALVTAIGKDTEGIEQMLRRVILPAIDPSAADGPAKCQEVARMESHAAVIEGWLGLYRRTDKPEHRNRVAQQQRLFQESLARFQGLRLTVQEKQAATQVGQRFKVAATRVNEWLLLHDARQDNTRRYAEVGRTLDGLLEDEVQAQAKHALGAAQRSADRAARTSVATVVFTLLASLGIGLASTIPIGRGIVKAEARERIAREEAEASRQRYSDLVNGLEAIVWEADARSGQCTFVSRQSEQVLGYPVQRWMTEPGLWVRILHPEDRDRVVQLRRDAVADGHNLDCEYRAQAADGRLVWLRDLVYVVKDGAGVVRQLRGIMVDVTAKRKMEETLLQSEEQLRNLVRALPAAVYTTDREGRITLYNDHAVELWGRRPELGTDRWCGSWRLFRPDGTPLSPDQCLMAGALREGHTERDEELVLERPDGSRVCVLAHPKPLRDGTGEVVGLVNLLVDVTDRKQAEEALRESEGQLRQLADSMPQIVWSAQPDGAFDYFNHRWYELTGLPEDQSGADVWGRVVHSDDLPVWHEQWGQAVKSGGAFQVECRLKDRNARGYRWHLCRALPVRSRSRRIVRWYGTCTEIDQQKRTEEALMLADRRKNEFLAVLSHELRNPLAPIRNALHILRLVPMEDPDLAEARDVIERQVQQLVGIVDDLLDVFRIAHQKMPLHKEPLNLVHVVRQTTEDYRRALEDTRLGLTVETPSDPAWVHGDRRRLAQVVTNLLSNAGKYSNPGDHVTVRVELDSLNQRVTVSVRDTGIGIAPDLLPHIFETFTQGEQSLDRQRGGLGLGLPLVKGIVELHGGAVQMTSEGQGKGATVTFTLPLSQRPRPPATPLPPTISSARPLRILIVEDSLDAAKTLGKLLTRFGHTVTMEHTGTAGVRTAREWQPDVILCDLGLPELDGFQVASTLRSNPDTASIRLIAVSGYGQDEDRRRSEAAGFDLHLTKPVDPPELQRLLTVLKVGP